MRRLKKLDININTLISLGVLAAIISVKKHLVLGCAANKRDFVMNLNSFSHKHCKKIHSRRSK